MKPEVGMEERKPYLKLGWRWYRRRKGRRYCQLLLWFARRSRTARSAAAIRFIGECLGQTSLLFLFTRERWVCGCSKCSLPTQSADLTNPTLLRWVNPARRQRIITYESRFSRLFQLRRRMNSRVTTQAICRRFYAHSCSSAPWWVYSAFREVFATRSPTTRRYRSTAWNAAWFGNVRFGTGFRFGGRFVFFSTEFSFFLGWQTGFLRLEEFI